MASSSSKCLNDNVPFIRLFVVVTESVLSCLEYADVQRLCVTCQSVRQSVANLQSLVHWMRDRDLLYHIVPCDDRDLPRQVADALWRGRGRFMYYYSDEESADVCPNISTLHDALQFTLEDSKNWNFVSLEQADFHHFDADCVLDLPSRDEPSHKRPRLEQESCSSCQSSYCTHVTQRLFCIPDENACHYYCGACMNASVALRLRFFLAHPELDGGTPDWTLQHADDDDVFGTLQADEFAVRLFYYCPYSSEGEMRFVGKRLPATLPAATTTRNAS